MAKIKPDSRGLGPAIHELSGTGMDPRIKSGGDEKKVTALLPPLKPKPPPRVA